MDLFTKLYKISWTMWQYYKKQRQNNWQTKSNIMEYDKEYFEHENNK